MKLLEHEAKTLLAGFGIEVPSSSLLTSPDHIGDPPMPVVVKSQVPIGGRGKSGGIKIVKTRSQLEKAVNELFTLDIKGFRPKSLLLESFIDIEREIYLSLTINRDQSCIDLVAHNQGSIEVESNKDFFRHQITAKTVEAVADELADYLGLAGKAFVLSELVDKLFNAFIFSDANLIEINPLVYTRSGNFVAGDCKMTLDDAAAFRHPEWNFEDKPTSSNFVILNKSGDIATMANGAGLAMATVDAISSAGLSPANFLDVGGTATVESIFKSFSAIVAIGNIKHIVINIFGGIVRCDDIASAIIEAKKAFPKLPSLHIRLSGNGSDQAKSILETAGLNLQPSLKDCIKEIEHEA